MKKTLLILTLAILFTTSLSEAQELSQSVKGKVTDIDTQAPLPGAYIILIGTNPIVGSITDVNGNYKLIDVHMTHWATCPKAPLFKKKGPK